MINRLTSALLNISGGGIADRDGGGSDASGVHRTSSSVGREGESSSLEEISTTRGRRVRLVFSPVSTGEDFRVSASAPASASVSRSASFSGGVGFGSSGGPGGLRVAATSPSFRESTGREDVEGAEDEEARRLEVLGAATLAGGRVESLRDGGRGARDSEDEGRNPKEPEALCRIR